MRPSRITKASESEETLDGRTLTGVAMWQWTTCGRGGGRGMGGGARAHPSSITFTCFSARQRKLQVLVCDLPVCRPVTFLGTEGGLEGIKTLGRLASPLPLLLLLDGCVGGTWFRRRLYLLSSVVPSIIFSIIRWPLLGRQSGCDRFVCLRFCVRFLFFCFCLVSSSSSWVEFYST